MQNTLSKQTNETCKQSNFDFCHVHDKLNGLIIINMKHLTFLPDYQTVNKRSPVFTHRVWRSRIKWTSDHNSATIQMKSISLKQYIPLELLLSIIIFDVWDCEWNPHYKYFNESCWAVFPCGVFNAFHVLFSKLIKSVGFFPFVLLLITKNSSRINLRVKTE